MQHFSKENMELMSIIARRLWLRRNSFIFEGVFLNPSEVFEGAIVTLKEFHHCTRPEQSSTEVTDEPPMTIQQACKPPPPLSNDHIKVNWGATINSKKGCVGLGIVA